MAPCLEARSARNDGVIAAAEPYSENHARGRNSVFASVVIRGGRWALHERDIMTGMTRGAGGAKTLMAGAACAVALTTMTMPASAASVRWKTIIGVIQAGNLVGNIPGGGQPWSTLDGRANVDLAAGRIDFEVRGLVLAGGNTIGNPGAINLVKGTLVCDAGTGAQQVVDTPLVPLDARGDAEFSGPVGPIPATCTPNNTVFLVRIAADRWIANGAVRIPGK